MASSLTLLSAAARLVTLFPPKKCIIVTLLEAPRRRSTQGISADCWRDRVLPPAQGSCFSAPKSPQYNTLCEQLATSKLFPTHFTQRSAFSQLLLFRSLTVISNPKIFYSPPTTQSASPTSAWCIKPSSPTVFLSHFCAVQPHAGRLVP